MRIAVDVSYVQKRRTGIGRYTTELLDALLTRDHGNEYILHGWSFSIDREWILGRERPNVRHSVARIPGQIRRFYWNSLRFPPLNSFIGEFDLFHSADPLLPPVAGRRTVATFHDIAYRRLPHLFQNSVLAWDPFVTRSATSASAVVVPSLFTRDEVALSFGIPLEKIVHVPPPVGDVFTDRCSDGDDLVRTRYGLTFPFILFVGTIEPRKNVVGLVRAFELLVEGHDREHHLVLIGKMGWNYEESMRAIGTSRARSRIHQFGYVPDDDLASIYRLASIFVYPSLYEGHGSPVVEAMACGKAVVTSNTSALREIAEGAAVLVDPSSHESICKGMSTTLENADMRTTFEKLARERARRFSHDAAASAIMQLYDTLGTS